MSVGRLYSQYLIPSFWLNMARRRLDYCCAIVASRLPWIRNTVSVCVRTSMLIASDRTRVLTFCICLFSCLSTSVPETVIATYQLEKLSCFSLAGLILGVSAFAFINCHSVIPISFRRLLYVTPCSLQYWTISSISSRVNIFPFWREVTSRGINSLYALHRSLTL